MSDRRQVLENVWVRMYTWLTRWFGLNEISESTDPLKINNVPFGGIILRPSVDGAVLDGSIVGPN